MPKENVDEMVLLFDLIYLCRESGEGSDDYEDDSREESSSEALHKWVNLKGTFICQSHLSFL